LGFSVKQKKKGGKGGDTNPSNPKRQDLDAERGIRMKYIERGIRGGMTGSKHLGPEQKGQGKGEVRKTTTWNT